jgi:AbrB family looped-hinge helix DNA binding protein
MKKRPYESKSTRIGAQGRVVLPSEVREAANLKQGDRLLVIVDENGIHLLTPLQGIRMAQALMRKYRIPGRDPVKELIRERREEVRREEAEGG